MSSFISVTDIGDALGEQVPADESGQVENLIDQAVAAIEGYLHPAGIPYPIPRAVRAVAVRMVVRSLRSEDAGLQPGMSGEMHVAGSFTHQRNFSSSASDGGVWMNRQDKQMLRPFRRRGGIVSVPYEMG